MACEGGALGRERFPTLATAGGARDRRPLANYHVTKLAGGASLTAIDLSVKNDASTDTLFDQHHDEIPYLADLGATEPKLCQGGSVGVVINCYRQSKRSP